MRDKDKDSVITTSPPANSMVGILGSRSSRREAESEILVLESFLKI